MDQQLTLYQARLLYASSDMKAETGERAIVFMRDSVAIWAFTIFVDSERFQNLNTPEWVISILIIMITMAAVQSVCAALASGLSLAQKMQLRTQHVAEGQRPYCTWDILMVLKSLILSGVYMCVEIALVALMIVAFRTHFTDGGSAQTWT